MGPSISGVLPIQDLHHDKQSIVVFFFLNTVHQLIFGFFVYLSYCLFFYIYVYFLTPPLVSSSIPQIQKRMKFMKKSTLFCDLKLCFVVWSIILPKTNPYTKRKLKKGMWSLSRICMHSSVLIFFLFIVKKFVYITFFWQWKGVYCFYHTIYMVWKWG